jgi:hypothetical protein
MASIDDIERLVRDFSAKYPESQAVFDRAEYEKALKQYGPAVTAKMVDQLFKQLLEEFTKNAAIYEQYYATSPACRKHPQGGCVCNKKA